MNENPITLGGLMRVIKSTKDITVNLYDENDLLKITFIQTGWEALDDFLCDDEVLELNFSALNKIDVKIDTSKNT